MKRKASALALLAALGGCASVDRTGRPRSDLRPDRSPACKAHTASRSRPSPPGRRRAASSRRALDHAGRQDRFQHRPGQLPCKQGHGPGPGQPAARRRRRRRRTAGHSDGRRRHAGRLRPHVRPVHQPGRDADRLVRPVAGRPQRLHADPGRGPRTVQLHPGRRLPVEAVEPAEPAGRSSCIRRWK